MSICGVCGWPETETVCNYCQRWALQLTAEIIKAPLGYVARVKARNRNVLVRSDIYKRRRSAARCLELMGFFEWEDVNESK